MYCVELNCNVFFYQYFNVSHVPGKGNKIYENAIVTLLINAGYWLLSATSLSANTRCQKHSKGYR